MELFVWLFLLAAPVLWIIAKLKWDDRDVKVPTTPAFDPTEEWGNIRRVRIKEDREAKATWRKDFSTLVQDACTHRFPPEDSLEQGWYICKDCGWEKPWHWEEGCGCNWVHDRALTDAYETKKVTYRSGNCRIHGMPRLIEHLYGKEARQVARGGIIY